jgi:enoyl-CoA hydratase/carnithine racemase
MAAISTAVALLEAKDSVRAIVITGAGSAFSSGGDRAFLKALTTMSQAEIRDTVYGGFVAAVRALRLSTKPTIAAVNGPAIAAGCEIALACDFRIIGRDAYFCESWIELGIIPPLGGMYLLPRLIGLERATNMVLRGTKVGGEEAVRIGLATEAVETADVLPRALAVGRELAARSAPAIAAARAGLRRGLENALADEWEHNALIQSTLLSGSDFASAVAAIEAGTRPTF